MSCDSSSSIESAPGIGELRVLLAALTGRGGLSQQ